jgi:hypothetical protein
MPPAPNGVSNRTIEIFAVMLLGIATVASAWCAYQSSQWDNQETREGRTATETRIEETRLYTRGTQLGMYDTTILTSYASAVANKQTVLSGFIMDTLVRPELAPIIREWEDKIASGDSDVSGLLDNPEYLDSLFADADAAEALAREADDRSEAAGRNANDYLMTTLFMASALFFAGVLTSLQSRAAKLLLLAAAISTLAIGAGRLAGLPVV